MSNIRSLRIILMLLIYTLSIPLSTFSRSSNSCHPCDEICPQFLTTNTSRPIITFKADTSACRIGPAGSLIGPNTDFVVGFGGNDYFCAPLPDGGIEITPGVPGVAPSNEFTNSVPPVPLNGPVLAGSPFDHVKFLASSIYTEAPIDGGELCISWLGSGEQLNVNNNPFGNAVVDAEEDLRLAAAAFVHVDVATNIVCDFFMTNKKIYAFVERLPLAGMAFGNYASYSYAIPVADRNPNVPPIEDIHRFQLKYNRQEGVITWVLDCKPVLRITQIGRRLTPKNAFTFDENNTPQSLKNPRRFLIIDHGGVDQDVRPAGFQPTIALFTLLDAYRPNNVNNTPNEALVRLEAARFRPGSSIPFYNDPFTGGSANFQQDCPLDMSGTQYTACIPSTFRIFGQDARLRLFDLTVALIPKSDVADKAVTHAILEKYCPELCLAPVQ